MKKVEKLSLEELQVSSFSELISDKEQLELYGGKGLTWSDIANMLGVAVETVMSWFGGSGSSSSNNTTITDNVNSGNSTTNIEVV